MIVSLNLPDDVVAFIDQQATGIKLSRSAWVAALLRNMQLVESNAGRQELARTLAAVMVEGALRSGQSIEQVRKAFPQALPQFEQDLAAESLPAPTADAPQLPAAHHAPPATDPIPVSVTRRRPYQRVASPIPHVKKR